MTDKIVKEITDFLPSLRAYSRSITFNDPDDLVQTTVLKAISNLHRFKEGTNLKAWLITILKNLAMNEFRRLRTLHTNQAYYVRSVNDIAPDNPEVSLIAKEIVCKLDTLCKDQRDAVFLISIDGMKYEEVAKQHNINMGTLKSRLSRGREKLRKFAE